MMDMARLRNTNGIPSHRIIIQCALLTLISFACASENCAHFNFPHWLPQGWTVSAPEQSLVTLPFVLDTADCPGGDSQTQFTYITQESSRAASGVDYCVVRLSRTECVSFKPQNCLCKDQDGLWMAVFTKTVRTSDSGYWLWQTEGGLTQKILLDIEPIQKKENDTPSSRGEKDKRKKVERMETNKKGVDDSEPKRGRPRAAPKKSLGLDSPGKPVSPTRKDLVQLGKKEEDEAPSNKHVHFNEHLEGDFNEEYENFGNDEEKVDDDEDKAVGDSSLTTGVVVGVLNVVSIVIVLIVVYVCRNRKQKGRRVRRPPSVEPPSPPCTAYDDATADRSLPPPLPRESYVSVTSGTYDVIPAACHSFENETYLIPMVQGQSCKENTYMPFA